MAERISSILQRYYDDPDQLVAELDETLVIHEERVGQDLKTQPQLFAHWYRLAVYAEERRDAYKEHAHVVVWLSAKTAARTLLTASGERPTDTRAEELANQNVAYLHATEYLRRWDKVVKLLHTGVEAMRQRERMLQSFNSRQKSELDSLPRGNGT